MSEMIFGFLTAFCLTYCSIPWVIRLSFRRKWLDKPTHRSSHRTDTPWFGGVVIFVSVLLTTLIWIPQNEWGAMQYILAAAFIVALTGFRDDLMPLSPWKKLICQCIAAMILVFAADLRFVSLFGLFGVEMLPYQTSVLLSIFSIVVITNGMNLIDGINGLSGTIGCIIATVLGLWFHLAGQASFAVLSLLLAGSLLAFLRYNYTPSSIFMGDTGALFCGLLLAVLVIRFINSHVYIDVPIAFDAVPVIAIALLILPLLDSVRVFILRLSAGRSPLQPDRLHIHHLMVDSGLSHTQTTVLLSGLNLIVVFSTIQLQWLGSNRLFLILFIFALITAYALQLVKSNLALKRQTV